MNWHEEYRKKYKELKEKGVPFFPDVVLLDTIAACLVFALLVYLAAFHPPHLEGLADPTDTNYTPRPEWYFLFLFQALKFFPGSMEAVAAIILPGALLGVLFLVPFLDRGPERHPFDRPLWTGLGIFGLCVYAGLTWAASKSPLANPAEEKRPDVIAGKRLYAQLSCAYCHQIKNEGGRVGPALDRLSDATTDEWLSKHLRDPQAGTPGSRMPKMNLLDDEVSALTAYIRSYNPNDPFTPAAPKLFAENCSACHRIRGEGGDLAPDLSEIGAMRDKAHIQKYIQDPAQFNPDSTMPAYKGQLKDHEIEDLSRYLARQRRR
ncbi:MAG: c-type cytochrome [Elusimicrobia bacterium]|nr:c-type cytochrome [Elusimicrobiota bacterium]